MTSQTDTLTAALPPVPEGFAIMEPYGPFHDLCGPMYDTQRGDRTVVGMYTQEKHRNKGRIVHGGMIFMLLDNAMTHACSQLRLKGCTMVTTAFSSEVIAAAGIGIWLEAEVEVLKAGRRVLFLNTVIRRDGPDGQIIARGSATFQILPRP